MNFVRSVIIFSLGDTFFKVNKMSLAKLYFTVLNNKKKYIYLKSKIMTEQTYFSSEFHL